jgi:hypothetical protein
MTREIFDLFCEIAIDAMERGKDLSLEQKEYFHDSKGVAGLGGGHTEDTGVILRVWQPEKESEQEQEEEDESND